MTIFETQRLAVREWQPHDAPALFEYASNPEVTAFLTFPTYIQMDEAHERMRERRALYSKHATGDPTSWADWAITLKSGEHKDKAIGSIGFSGYDEKSKIAEIGYMLNINFQGKGYMSEALSGFLSWVANNPSIKKSGIKTIIAKFDLENIASKRVLEKAGFQFRELRPSGVWNNKNRTSDAVVFEFPLNYT